MFPGLSAELVSAWDQPVGDTGGRLKGGKKRNQAISHLSYLFKAASPAANLPVKFFLLLFHGSGLSPLCMMLLVGFS